MQISHSLIITNLAFVQRPWNVQALCSHAIDAVLAVSQSFLKSDGNASGLEWNSSMEEQPSFSITEYLG